MAFLQLSKPRNEEVIEQITATLKTVYWLIENKDENDIVLDFGAIDYFFPSYILPLIVQIDNIEKHQQNEELVTPAELDINLLGYLNIIGFETKGIITDNISLTELEDDISGKNYIPILNFSASFAEENCRNQILSIFNRVLLERAKLSSNYYSAILYIISEFTDNIVQHSESERGWIFCQYYKSKGFLEVCIIDTGISFLGSYQKHDEHKSITNDVDALKNALNGLSTKPGTERGHGIRSNYDMIINGLLGDFVLISGSAMYHKDRLSNEQYYRLPFHWKGTILSIRINSDISNFKYYNFVK